MEGFLAEKPIEFSHVVSEQNMSYYVFSSCFPFLGSQELNDYFLPFDTKLLPSLKLQLRDFLLFAFVILHKFANGLLPLVLNRIPEDCADSPNVLDLAHKLFVCRNMVCHRLI